MKYAHLITVLLLLLLLLAQVTYNKYGHYKSITRQVSFHIFKYLNRNDAATYILLKHNIIYNFQIT